MACRIAKQRFENAILLNIANPCAILTAYKNKREAEIAKPDDDIILDEMILNSSLFEENKLDSSGPNDKKIKIIAIDVKTYIGIDFLIITTAF